MKGDNCQITTQSVILHVSDEFVLLMLSKMLHDIIHYVYKGNWNVTLRRERAEQIRDDLSGTK
jgi:metal-dependent HD superfamily phosphatase/phosphodiesterase